MQNPRLAWVRARIRADRWQFTAFLFCFFFGIAIIVNVQLSGEATWFWYATLMQRGAKLYTDMHLPLQPLYPLETKLWMELVGVRSIPFQMISVIHLFLFCFGLYLLLCESLWPDWRKAVLFLGVFFTDVYFFATRFDDFHIVNDVIGLFLILALLRLNRATSSRLILRWSAIAGLLGGMAFANRPNDGGSLLVAAALCVPFFARRQRLLSIAFYLVCTVAMLLLLVRFTGDTYQSWFANSIHHAASAKGGAHNVLRGPWIAVRDNLHQIRISRRIYWFVPLLVCGLGARRFWPRRPNATLEAELGCAALLLFLLFRWPLPLSIARGYLIPWLNTPVQFVIYPLALWALFRAVRAFVNPAETKSNPLELLVFFPAGLLFSSAMSQGTGSTDNTISMALLLLISSLILPFTARARLWNDSLVVVCLLLAITGATYKVGHPYAWGTYLYDPMFERREWYRHPVYGSMYIESDLLHFIQPICQEMQTSPDKAELLSLPYSYANYFCNTPPWGGYVQTWYDTSTSETIEALMKQLDQQPPRWILYQRQLSVLRNHEVAYHNGFPITHRKLDEQIMTNLTSGKWHLVDHRQYLLGDGWYLIDTSVPGRRYLPQ